MKGFRGRCEVVLSEESDAPKNPGPPFEPFTGWSRAGLFTSLHPPLPTVRLSGK